MSQKSAISKLKKGINIITYFKKSAKKIANYAGSVSSKCDQKHLGAYSFNHYHVKSKKIKHSIHSFYVIGG